MKESQLESLSAKLKAKALSDEKKLLRAFTSIDTDGSGSLGRVELEAALATLQLDVAKAGDLFKAMGGIEGEGVTFAQFKSAIKIGGGKSFEKALTAEIMQDGEVVSWATLEQTLAKRKGQIAELEEALKATPGDADLEAKLKKRVTQCDAIAAKGKAFAAQENVRLKDVFAAVDTSKDGTVDLAEVKAAISTMDLASVDGDKLLAAVEAAGGAMDFDGWKKAIKEDGGAAFQEMLGRHIGADGKMHLFSA